MPTSNRFYTVKIGDLWLTKDGSETGKPCKLEIQNVEQLWMDKTGSAGQAADGSIFRQLVDVHGVRIQISVRQIMKDVFDDLLELLNEVNNTGASLPLLISGKTKDLAVSCTVDPEAPVAARDFLFNRINQVSIKLIIN